MDVWLLNGNTEKDGVNTPTFLKDILCGKD